MMRIRLDAQGFVIDSRGPGGELYPDDTVIRAEDRRGQSLKHAPPRISRFQPDGWAARAGRRWDELTMLWVRVPNVDPIETEPTKAQRRLQELKLPDRPTPEQLAAAINDLKTVLLETAKRNEYTRDNTTAQLGGRTGDNRIE